MLFARKLLRYFCVIVIFIFVILAVDFYIPRRVIDDELDENSVREDNTMVALVNNDETLPAILREADKYLDPSEKPLILKENKKSSPKIKIQRKKKIQSKINTSFSTLKTTSTSPRFDQDQLRINEMIEWELPQRKTKVKVTPIGWAYKGPNNIRCKVNEVGCFLPTENLVITEKIKRIIFSNMTDWICIEMCSKSMPTKGRKLLDIVFANIRNGNECLCSFGTSSFETIVSLEEVNKCDVPCVGDSSIKCGGRRNITMVYRVLPKCLPAPTLERVITEQVKLGCHWKPLDFEPYMEEYFITANQSTLAAKCLLLCESKGLIIAVPLLHDRCYCGLTTSSFNLQNPVEDTLCKKHKNDYVMVYRTQSEDRRCAKRRFLRKGEMYRKIALATFPGSGNTWMRYLIESATGIYTGSKYGDRSLAAGGYIGEIPSMHSYKLAVIKTHQQIDINNSSFDAVINVHRNPYNAILSEFNRRSTNRHTAAVDSDNFDREAFSQIIMGQFPKKWRFTTRVAVQTNKSKLIFAFEDAVEDPIKYAEKMARFIMGDHIDENDLQNRLLCLQLASTGDFKRKKRPLKFDPFPDEAKIQINEQIELLDSTLQKAGLEPLPDYKRSPSSR
uniref:WSC domain-containing protein 2-like n=1 Tax=Styela clava TaxID=7725 RepID=UPI001939D0DF|nr:WSC domain-containing protein 2-like [Styela clava]